MPEDKVMDEYNEIIIRLLANRFGLHIPQVVEWMIQHGENGYKEDLIFCPLFHICASFHLQLEPK